MSDQQNEQPVIIIAYMQGQIMDAIKQFGITADKLQDDGIEFPAVVSGCMTCLIQLVAAGAYESGKTAEDAKAMFMTAAEELVPHIDGLYQSIDKTLADEKEKSAA